MQPPHTRVRHTTRAQWRRLVRAQWRRLVCDTHVTQRCDCDDASAAPGAMVVLTSRQNRPSLITAGR